MPVVCVVHWLLHVWFAQLPSSSPHLWLDFDTFTRLVVALWLLVGSFTRLPHLRLLPGYYPVLPIQFGYTLYGCWLHFIGLRLVVVPWLYTVGCAFTCGYWLRMFVGHLLPPTLQFLTPPTVVLLPLFTFTVIPFTLVCCLPLDTAPRHLVVTVLLHIWTPHTLRL